MGGAGAAASFTRSAHFSPIIMQVMQGLVPIMVGKTEASASTSWTTPRGW